MSATGMSATGMPAPGTAGSGARAERLPGKKMRGGERPGGDTTGGDTTDGDVSSVSGPRREGAVVGRTLVRLGGGQPEADLEAHERSGYALTGTAVAATTLVAGGVAAAACAPMWTVPVVVAVVAGVVVVTGLIARVLASSPGTAPRRAGFLGRLLLALVLGAFLGETAAVVATSAAVDRVLDEKAHAAAGSAPRVAAAGAALERALDDRAALQAAIGEGESEVERALVTARCEYNPTAGCPPTRITGVPGDGPEHRTARAMLDDARTRLAEARDRTPALDQRVAAAESELAAARSAAERAGDRGPGARWTAMHEHTTASATALATRLAILLGGLLIALLPLVVRRRLGVTSLDRHAAARAAMDAAEREADIAIVVQRARMRAAAGELRAEQAVETLRLTAARPTPALPQVGATRAFTPSTRGAAVAGPGADAVATAGAIPAAASVETPSGVNADPVEPFGDGRRHTRVIAAFGGIEIGLTESARPVGAEPEAAELPGLVPLPFAAWLGPLVPAFVLEAVDSATRPLRTARRAIDEVKELTFTLRHDRVARVVTVAVRETAPGAGVGAGRAVTATVIDARPVMDAGPVVDAGPAVDAGPGNVGAVVPEADPLSKP